MPRAKTTCFPLAAAAAFLVAPSMRQPPPLRRSPTARSPIWSHAPARPALRAPSRRAGAPAVRLSDGAVLPGGSPGMAIVKTHGLNLLNWNSAVPDTLVHPMLKIVHARWLIWAELPAALRFTVAEGLVSLALIGATVGALAALAALRPLRQVPGAGGASEPARL